MTGQSEYKSERCSCSYEYIVWIFPPDAVVVLPQYRELRISVIPNACVTLVKLKLKGALEALLHLFHPCILVQTPYTDGDVL